jgi:hypothetical protein
MSIFDFEYKRIRSFFNVRAGQKPVKNRAHKKSRFLPSGKPGFLIADEPSLRVQAQARGGRAG